MAGCDLSRAGALLRAAALSVRGLGPAAVTVAGLAAGGGALLLFVFEECPTCVVALRGLGPLCGAWRAAGLTATAVFEDPLEVAVRVARRLGWRAGVAAGDPPYETSRAYQLVAVPAAVLVGRAGMIAGIPEATGPLVKPGCSSTAVIDPELAAAVSVPASAGDVGEMFERG